MTHDEFNQICSSLPVNTAVMPWGGSHVWKVGGKVFAIGGWSRARTPTMMFKVSDLDFDLLSEEPGFQPAPYCASRGMKWIQHFDNSGATDDVLDGLLRASHHLVSLGLTSPEKCRRSWASISKKARVIKNDTECAHSSFSGIYGKAQRAILRLQHWGCGAA